MSVSRHEGAKLWATLDVVALGAGGVPEAWRAVGSTNAAAPVPPELGRALADAGPDAVGYAYSFAMHDAFRLEQCFLSLAEST